MEHLAIRLIPMSCRLRARSRARTRLAPLAATGLALLLFALPAAALDFTVHGYDLGERIELTTGRHVWTAEFDVSLEGAADHIASYCVDLDTYISPRQYTAREVLDAFTAPSPADEAPRNFAWAGSVMVQFGHDVDGLVDAHTTRDQAITGVQAAIWEGLYGGGLVEVTSLSAGAQDVFRRIMAHPVVDDGTALVVDLVGAQDQVVSAPVPEPSAALIFGLGSLIAGCAARRR